MGRRGTVLCRVALNALQKLDVTTELFLYIKQELCVTIATLALMVEQKLVALP